MWRKIIDDYRLLYLNDLFEIKLIFYGLSCMLHFSEFKANFITFNPHKVTSLFPGFQSN